MADTTPPTISITTNKSVLRVGDIAKITFALSEAATNFIFSDVSVSGGILSGFDGSGMLYTASFTPFPNSTSTGSVSVKNNRFSDSSGNTNQDGSDADNLVAFTVDTRFPSVSISASKTYLGLNETPTITFSLSALSSNFNISDISVSGGTLSFFQGSGISYSAIFTPTGTYDGVVSVSSSRFTDLAGNNNAASTELVFTPYDESKVEIVWTRTLGSNAYDSAKAISISGDGSIFLSGWATGNLDGQTSSGNGDAFLTKYNSDGTKAWTRLVGSSSGDFANALTTGLDGSIFICGYAGGSIDGQTSFGGTDGFVTKYTSDGTKAWTRQLGTNGYDEARALTTGLDGSIYVAGATNGYVNQETNGNLDGQTSSGNGDAFLIKYNSDGTKAWTRLIGSSASEGASALTTGLDGSIYLGGTTTGNLDGQTNNGNQDALLTLYNSNGTMYRGNIDSFLTKFNPDGTKAWTRLVGSTGEDSVQSLATGLDGSIYVSGYTNGSIDGQTSEGTWDAFLTKFNPDGSKAWTRQLDSPCPARSSGDEFAYALTIGLDGSIYVGGSTTGSLDGYTNFIGKGASDVFLAKFLPDGTRAWAQQLGSNSISSSVFNSPYDQLNALTTGKDGSIYLSGNTYGNLDGQANSGDSDAFLIKLKNPITSLPTINISSRATTLTVGESTDVLFTFNCPVSDFIFSDISVQGGTLSNFDNFKSLGTIYTATFTAEADGAKGTNVSVGSGKFSNTLGIFNSDGNDANNKVSFSIQVPVDTTPPTIAVTSSALNITATQTAIITFALSESSTTFTLSDVSVIGGALINFIGSGTTYTALFTPTANSTVNGTVSVASGVFTDAAGNANTDGSDTNNTITLAVDTVVPTIALSSTKISLIAGETTTLTFTLSEVSTTFTASDINVTGGTLSNFTGSGTSYTALFTPTANSNTNGTVSISSGVFTDTAGNTNTDGADANNLLTLAVDTLLPTIAVASNKSSLQGGDSATLTFTLSEVSTSFVSADVVVSGGTLSNFAGSGTSYTATYTLGSNSTLNGTIGVANGVFTDAAGNKNADGSDANNSVNFSRIPTVTNETHTLSVIVDKNVLGPDAVLLKDLKESMTFTNGAITKHIVEYSGLTFDYSQIDSLITTVTRDGEFTTEFTKEINDYLGAEQNITYSVAVAIVGAASIDGIILVVAGADGNFVG